jgi:predicted ester cyclase
MAMQSGTQSGTDYLERQRVWVEGLNSGDLSSAEEAFAPDCVIHITGSPVPELNLEGFTQMTAGFLAAFPDMRFTPADIIVAGDKAARRWTAEGTNTGPLGDIPATGKRVWIEGVLLDRIANGKVVERWEQWDQLGMLKQLGLA